MVWTFHVIMFGGQGYRMVDRTNLIQITIEPGDMESDTNVENGSAYPIVQQTENINMITNKAIICTVGSEPIVTTPKLIRRYEPSVLRAVNHAGQNKQVLPFRLVRTICALKINKNRRKTRTWKPGSSKYRLRGINCSNLIEITTAFEELKFFHTSKVQLGLINVQSMKNKEITLLDHITENDLDFLIITKTWLTDSTADSQWKTTSRLTTKPLKLLSQNRDGQRGSGIALIHKEPYTVDVKSAGTRDSFENMIVECRTKSDTFSIITIYRPPYLRKHQVTISMFTEDFISFMEETLLDLKNPIILGDFNIHINDTDNADAITFVDSMEALGLVQHVSKYTHMAGNILDLIYTFWGDGLSVQHCNVGPFVSDHRIVLVAINLRKLTLTWWKIKTRKTKDIRPSDFESEFNKNIPETDNIDELNLAYNKELTRVYDKLAPVKEITITSRTQTPWFDSELNELKQKVRQLEQKWAKYRLESCWKAYKVNQNAYYYLIRKKKKQFISENVKQCGKDTKKLYKLVNALMGNNTENPMPKAKSDEELAQQFADFFLEKIQKIRKMFQDITPPSNTRI